MNIFLSHLLHEKGFHKALTLDETLYETQIGTAVANTWEILTLGIQYVITKYASINQRRYREGGLN